VSARFECGFVIGALPADATNRVHVADQSCDRGSPMAPRRPERNGAGPRLPTEMARIVAANWEVASIAGLAGSDAGRVVLQLGATPHRIRKSLLDSQSLSARFADDEPALIQTPNHTCRTPQSDSSDHTAVANGNPRRSHNPRSETDREGAHRAALRAARHSAGNLAARGIVEVCRRSRPLSCQSLERC
jgi:hypothetical protein